MLFKQLMEKANEAGAKAVKESGIEHHPLDCGWAWIQVQRVVGAKGGGLCGWLEYENGGPYNFTEHVGGFSYLIDGPKGRGNGSEYQQSMGMKYKHAEAMAEYINKEISKSEWASGNTAHVFAMCRYD